MELIKIIIADGSIGVKAMIFGLTFNGLRVELNSFLVVFVFEGLVSLFFPLLGTFLNVHFIGF